MALFAAAAALVLMALSGLVQPTTAAADPFGPATSRPDETAIPEPPVSLAPDQSILSTPSASATEPTPPAEVTTPPVETGTTTPDPTNTPSDPPSSDPSPTETQTPTGAGSSEPPPVSPNGSSSSTTTTTTTTPPPPVSPSNGPSSTVPTSGTTTTPVQPEPEPEPAPAVENVKWRNALFTAAKSLPQKAPTTLAPSVNTVPVVTARPVCGGIVFANPDSAYSAAVTYGEFNEAPATPLRLRPTKTKFVPISAARVDWAALSGDPDPGASTQIVGAAGYGESVAIPQCSREPGEIRVVAMAPCLARGQDAVIMVDNGTKPDSSELSWRISRKGDPLVLAQGVLGRTAVSSVDLSSFGVGTYTVSVLQNGEVEDHVDFAALDCVSTVADCAQVMVTNPVRNPVPVTVTWRTDAGGARAKKANVVELAPGGNVAVPAVAGSLQWSAISTGWKKSTATSLVGDAGSDLTTVTESCATPTSTGGPTGGTGVPGTPEGTTATPAGSSASGPAVPSSSGSSGGTPPGTLDAGPDMSSSAVLLGGIAVGGAALVWLLAALLRRRP